MCPWTVYGIVAFDSIGMVDGDQLIPSVRWFYGSPSVYLWEDDMGETHEILQGEGGEAVALQSGTAQGITDSQRTPHRRRISFRFS